MLTLETVLKCVRQLFNLDLGTKIQEDFEVHSSKMSGGITVYVVTKKEYFKGVESAFFSAVETAWSYDHGSVYSKFVVVLTPA